MSKDARIRVLEKQMEQLLEQLQPDKLILFDQVDKTQSIELKLNNGIYTQTGVTTITEVTTENHITTNNQ